MRDSRQQVWDEFARAIELFDRKNADYGDAWRANGWRGNLSRVFEKNQRVRNLLWRTDPRTPAVGDEAAVETLRDMLNSIVFAIINLQEEVEYGHEVPRSQRFSELEKGYTPGDGERFYHQVVQEQTPDDPWATKKTLDQAHTLEDLSSLAEQVSTAFVPREAVQAAVTHGPDEMRPAEQQGTGQKSPRGKGRPVRDNPQA